MREWATWSTLDLIWSRRATSSEQQHPMAHLSSGSGRRRRSERTTSWLGSWRYKPLTSTLSGWVCWRRSTSEVGMRAWSHLYHGNGTIVSMTKMIMAIIKFRFLEGEMKNIMRERKVGHYLLSHIDTLTLLNFFCRFWKTKDSTWIHAKIESERLEVCWISHR